MNTRKHQSQTGGHTSKRRVVARGVPRDQVDLRKLAIAALAQARAEAAAQADHQRRTEKEAS